MHRWITATAASRSLAARCSNGALQVQATSGVFHLLPINRFTTATTTAGSAAFSSNASNDNNNDNNNSSNNNNSNNNKNNNTNNIFSLRRPPQRQEQVDPRRAKWRKHAVSLEFGNYADYDDDDVDLERNNTQESRPQESWQEEEQGLAHHVQELQEEEDAQKKRWLENARPPVRESVIDDRGRAYGRGGRKTATARVWVQPGFGNFVVNQMDLVDYFDRQTDRELLLAPLAATQTCGKLDVTAIVSGGGLTGQAGAIRHGLARALNHYNPDHYRPPLKRLGYLTRDPRKVERKKIGHLKARKKPQWVKR